MPPSGPILFVTRNFPPARGGIETLAVELVRHGLAAGLPLVLVHVGQQPCRDLPAGLIAYHHLPGTGRWAALFSAAWHLPRLARRYRPRLIVNVQVTTGLGSLIASRRPRIPYAVLCMGLEVLPGGIPPWRALRGAILRRAERVISISRFTDSLAAAFGVPPERRRVAHPGARLFAEGVRGSDRDSLFGPEAASVFVILSLTRLVPRKGIDKAIEALALVARTRRDFLYCVGGSGPDLPRLQGLAAALGVADRVRFLGRIADEDLGPCYAGADLFLLPSRSTVDPPDAEGFGIVFLEAGSCGTPSLGGKSGGIPDAVRDGETGFLVDPEDPAAIAEKILLLMSDRDLLRNLGEGARRYAEASTWDKAAPRFFDALPL